MKRAAARALASLLFATAGFVLSYGLEEYHFANDAGVKFLRPDGSERSLSPDEKFKEYFVDSTIRALKPGVIASGIILTGMSAIMRLGRAAWQFRRRELERFYWETVPATSAHPVRQPFRVFWMTLFGALFGGFLSFVVYAIIGGWGPPFFLQSVVAGGLTGICIGATTSTAASSPRPTARPRA